MCAEGLCGVPKDDHGLVRAGGEELRHIGAELVGLELTPETAEKRFEALLVVVRFTFAVAEENSAAVAPEGVDGAALGGVGEGLRGLGEKWGKGEVGGVKTVHVGTREALAGIHRYHIVTLII